MVFGCYDVLDVDWSAALLQYQPIRDDKEYFECTFKRYSGRREKNYIPAWLITQRPKLCLEAPAQKP